MMNMFLSLVTFMVGLTFSRVIIYSDSRHCQSHYQQPRLLRLLSVMVSTRVKLVLDAGFVLVLIVMKTLVVFDCKVCGGGDDDDVGHNLGGVVNDGDGDGDNGNGDSGSNVCVGDDDGSCHVDVDH